MTAFDGLDVALAGSSTLAAEAGEEVARVGGNAVDAAIAAILVSMTTEPAIIGLGAGGFVTVMPSGQDPVTIDGYVEMPGRGLPPDRLGGGCQSVSIGYGGGLTTQVGPGSIGTPGALAALEEASHRFGRVPWATVLGPAIGRANRGFPLPQASHDYLVHSHEEIFGWDPNSFVVLHDESGRLRGAGETIVIEHLADTLAALSTGTDVLYRGSLGASIVEAVQDANGLLTSADLEAYRAVVRTPLGARLGSWSFSTNPPPALGGLVLSAMLRLMEGRATAGWSADDVAHLVQVQESVLSFRAQRLATGSDLAQEAARLLGVAGLDALRALIGSPSTVQASAVDSEGTACSISVSTGYGSGMMPAGTGMWLNNCLGEIELNPRGLHADRPGTRLTSNMAPTVGLRDDGAVLAIASPGADRITTALLQVLVNLVNVGMSLDDAVRSPRLHVELAGEGTTIAHEAGIAFDDLDLPARPFDGLSMFFGGVGVAVMSPDGDMRAASDPRRSGGAVVVRT